MKRIIPLALVSALALGISLSSCGSSAKSLYSWYGYDDIAYDYSKSQSPESLEKLTKTYQKMIQKQDGTRGVVPPGVYAEYGYLLIKQGKTQEGIALMEQEIALYPESSVFISRIIKQFK